MTRENKNKVLKDRELKALEEVKRMDNREELKDHMILINKMQRKLNRHRIRANRIESIGLKPIEGVKDKLFDYKAIIELIIVDIEDSIYYRDDKRVRKQREKWGDIKETCKRQGIEKSIEELNKYIHIIRRSNNEILGYYREFYYKSINVEIFSEGDEKDESK